MTNLSQIYVQSHSRLILQVSFSAGMLGMLQITPVYADSFADDWQSQFRVTTFTDHRTDDNASNGDTRWTVDPGADRYSRELYERPFSSMDETVGGAPAASTYFEFLDISTGQVALDRVNKHAYFSIDLVGQDEVSGGSSSTKGFSDYYRIRLSSNRNFASTGSDVSSYMFGVKDPSGKLTGSFNDAVAYENTQVWYDDPADGAVSGTGISVTDEGTNGYAELTSEGSSADIRARLDGDSIQFVLNYGDSGLDLQRSVFKNIMFETTKGLSDTGNYFWNDEYSLDEAGTPYDLYNRPENIYEVDTLLGGLSFSAAPAPELGSRLSGLILIGGLFCLMRRRLQLLIRV